MILCVIKFKCIDIDTIVLQNLSKKLKETAPNNANPAKLHSGVGGDIRVGLSDNDSIDDHIGLKLYQIESIWKDLAKLLWIAPI